MYIRPKKRQAYSCKDPRHILTRAHNDLMASETDYQGLKGLKARIPIQFLLQRTKSSYDSSGDL